LVPASIHLFQTLSLGIFFFSSKRKEKKNHGEKKKCNERKELSFKLPLCPLIFGSRFYPSVSNTFFWHLLLLK